MNTKNISSQLNIIQKYQNILTIDDVIPAWLFVIFGIGTILGYFFSELILNLNLLHNKLYLILFWCVLLLAILSFEVLFLKQSPLNLTGLMKHKELSLLVLSDIFSTLFNLILVILLVHFHGVKLIPSLVLLTYGIFGLFAGMMLNTKINYFSGVLVFLSIFILLFIHAHIYMISILIAGSVFILFGIFFHFLKKSKKHNNQPLPYLKDKIMVFKKKIPIPANIGVLWGIIFFLMYTLYKLYRHKTFITTNKEFIFSIIIILLLALIYEYIALLRGFKKNNFEISMKTFWAFFSSEIYLTLFMGILSLVLYQVKALPYLIFLFNLFFGLIWILASIIITQKSLIITLTFIVLAGTSLFFPTHIIDINLIGAGVLFFTWSGTHYVKK